MDFDSLRCQIKYDGPALKEHTIDVNQLAPALLAFSEAMTKISKYVSPEQSAICNVKIKAFNEGCFISDLIIETIQENPDDFVGMAGTIMAGTTAHVDFLFKIFVDVVKGILFRKTNDGKEINIQVNIGGTVNYNVTGNGNTIATDNAKLTISSEAHQIIEEGKIDAELRHIVSPLSQDKIDDLSVVSERDSETIGFDVSQNQREYFFGEQETKTMWVKVKGEIENMHKRYRTFGLVEGKSKIPCYIPKEEALDKYADLFNASLVEIEGEAEMNAEDNTIVKIKVTGGRKIQTQMFTENE